MGEPGPGVVSSETVAAGGPEDGQDGPSRAVPAEVEPVSGEDGDSDQTHQETEALEPSEGNAKPAEPDEGGTDGGSGIEQGAESGSEMEAGPAEEAEGQRRVEEAQDREGELAVAEGAAVSRAQEEGKEGKGGPGNAGEGGGDRPEFRNGDAHEQEGGSPDCGEEDQSAGVGKAHLCLAGSLWRPRKLCSRKKGAPGNGERTPE